MIREGVTASTARAVLHPVTLPTELPMIPRLLTVALALTALAASPRADTLRVPQDFATIAAAAEAALPSDVIEVSSGTYEETVEIDEEGVVLRGKGKVVIVGSTTAPSLRVQSTDGVVVERITFTGGQNSVAVEFDGADGVLVDRCRFEDVAHGVEGLDCSGLVVRSCRFDGVENAVFLSNCSRSAILSNRIGKGVSFDAIQINTGSGIDVARNVAKSDGTTFVSANAGDEVVVRDNRISGFTDTAIDVRAEHSVVSGNRIKGGVRGVFAGFAGDIHVLGNTISDVSIVGIEAISTASSAVICGNLIRKSGGDGIDVAGINGTVADNRVIAVDGAGIRTESNRNFVTDNVVRKAAGGSLVENQILTLVDIENDVDDAAPSGYPVFRVPQDFPTIQAAFDAAVPESVIEISSGVYDERLTLSFAIDVEIRAKGKVVIRDTSGAPGDAATFTDCLDITLRGLRFEGDQDGPNDTVVFDECEESVIVDCRFKGRIFAIRLLDSDTIALLDNRFEDGVFDVISIDSTSLHVGGSVHVRAGTRSMSFLTSQDMSISGCRVTAAVDSATAIDQTSFDGPTVYDCTFAKVRLGVDFEGREASVVDNVFRKSAAGRVDGEDAVVIGNRVLASPTLALRSLGASGSTVLAGNTIRKSAGDGISLDGFGALVSDNSIRTVAAVGVRAVGFDDVIASNSIRKALLGTVLDGSNTLLVGNDLDDD